METIIVSLLTEIAESVRDIKENQHENLRKEILQDILRELSLSGYSRLYPCSRKYNFDNYVTFVENEQRKKMYGNNENSIDENDDMGTYIQEDIANYEDIASDEDKDQLNETKESNIIHYSMGKKISNDVLACNVEEDRESIFSDNSKPLSSVTEDKQLETKNKQLETYESDTSIQPKEQNIVPTSYKEGDQCPSAEPDNSENSESESIMSVETQIGQHEAIGYNIVNTDGQMDIRNAIQYFAGIIGINVIVNSFYMVKILSTNFRFLSDCHINDMLVFHLTLHSESLPVKEDKDQETKNRQLEASECDTRVQQEEQNIETTSNKEGSQCILPDSSEKNSESGPITPEELRIVRVDRETILSDNSERIPCLTENIQPETTKSDTSVQQEEQNIAPTSDKEGDQCIRPDNSDSSESDPITSDVQKTASALEEQKRLQYKATVIGNNMITEEQNKDNENRYIEKNISTDVHESRSLTQLSDIIVQGNASVQGIRSSNIILNCSVSLQTSRNIDDYSNHFSPVETRQYLYDTWEGRYIIECFAQTIGIDVCVNSLHMVKILSPHFRYISDCHIDALTVFHNEYIVASESFSVDDNILPLGLKRWSADTYKTAQNEFTEHEDGKLIIHKNTHRDSKVGRQKRNLYVNIRTTGRSQKLTRKALLNLIKNVETYHNNRLYTYKTSLMVQTQKHFTGNQRRIVSAPIVLGKRENRSNQIEIISSSDECSDVQVYNNRTMLQNQPSIICGIICIAVDSLLLYELCVSSYILLASCIHYLDTSEKENIFRTSSVRLNVVHFEYFESAMRESIRIQVQLTFTNIYTRDNRIPTAVPIYMYSFIYRKDQLR